MMEVIVTGWVVFNILAIAGLMALYYINRG